MRNFCRRKHSAALAGVIGAGVASCLPLADARAQDYLPQVYQPLLDSEIPLTTQTGRNQGVAERPHPELDAQGLPLGGFRAYPEIMTGIGYTSNVVGAENGARSDGFILVRPQLQLRSQWANHSLIATASYDGRRYFDTPQKNHDGYDFNLNGRVDVSKEGQIFLNADARRIYEDQTSGNFPQNGGGAIALDVTSLGARAVQRLNRFILTASADHNHFDFNPTVTTTGVKLNLDYRDYSVDRASTRIEYQLSPDNAVFTQFTYKHTSYSLHALSTDRSGNEWRASVGAIADVTSLLRVAGGVGYFWRSYDNPTLKRISSLNVDVQATYYLSPLTTISGTLTRELEEAAVNNSSGFIMTRGMLRIDHELLRNLRPFAYGSLEADDFKDIDRNDRLINLGVGLLYDPNRYLSLSGELAYINRQSNGVDSGPRFDEMRALITARAKL